MPENEDISKNQADSQSKTENMKAADVNEGVAANGGVFTRGYTLGGSNVMSVGRDIMTGATFQKYTDTKKLEGVQLQYASGSGNLKVVNFKQDYVVLIRKKLFYAANADSQIDNEDATKDDGNYVRSYKVDTFTGLRTNISINGSPGTCQIDIQGAQFIYCFEESSVTTYGAPTVDEMVSDEFPDNYAQLSNDSNNAMGVNSNSIGSNTAYTERQKVEVNNMILNEARKGDIWNRDDAKSFPHPSAKGVTVTMKTRKNPDGLTGNVHVMQSNGIEYDLTLPIEGATADSQNQMGDGGQEEVYSGLKIAEKCDFEPMDEVWVFGKSNFERDPNTGDFKMNQIFFGYIDDVKKNYSSGKTAGTTINISATDQLKMLDLSYVTLNPTMTPGASGSQGLDLRYSAQDRKHFGTFEIFNPYMVSQMLGAYGSAENATDAQKEVLTNAWKYLSLTNVFAGKPVCEIITQLCKDAGIPTWYLKERIEPIMFPPFVYQLKNSNSSTLFNGAMMKRLQECRDAAKKLLLEFFADEEGNIVLKVPNYALGANTLVKNNMGFEQLDGGMLGNIDIDNIQPFYSSNTEPLQDSMNQEAAKSTDDDSVEAAKNAASVRRQLTPAAKEYLYQRAMETMAYYNGDKDNKMNADYTQMSWFMNGATETQELARRIAQQRTHNPYWNTGSNNTVRYTFKEGDTFGSVAEEHLNHSRLAWDIQQQAQAQLGIGELGLNDCYKCYGKEITIDLNRTTNGTMKEGDVRRSADEMEKSIGELDVNNEKYATTQYLDENGNVINGKTARHKTQQEYEAVARQYYDTTLSEMTDALIPEIPQEYIISFSLTDSDKQIYNMYEVNIEGDFGIFDKGGPLIKISRVFPDIASMLRFGCRPMQTPYSFPYMGNKENAHLLGFMLTAMSMARRKSATLSMIEDSFIKVGNPVRFFAYDEHPDEPLSPQGNHSDAATVLNRLGANGNTDSLQDITNDLNAPYMYDYLSRRMDNIDKNKQESEQGKQQVIVDDGNTQGTGEVQSESNQGNLQGQTGVNDAQSQQDAKNDEISNADETGDYEEIPNSKNVVLKHKAGASKPSDYSGVPASVVAMNTDAQSIYYVEQVSRSIGVSKESTMTLTLSCGRMMGKPSSIDYMLLLYKAFFDPALGFCADIKEITKYKNKYTGNTHAYKIKAGDTKDSIMSAEYANVDFGVNHDVAIEEPKEEDNKDPYLVDNLLKDDSVYPAKDGVYSTAKSREWNRLTSVVSGKVYQINPNQPSRGKVLFTYKYFIFDAKKTCWVFVREGGDDTGIPEQNVTPDDESIAYDMQDNMLVNGLYVKSEKKDVQFLSQGTEENFLSGVLDDPPKQDKLTKMQKLIEEFTNAVIALNPEKFGNALAVNNAQFNIVLHDNMGNEIIIPNNLTVDTNSNDNGNKNSSSSADNAQTVDTTEQERQTYGDNAVKKQYEENGKYITEIEGDNMYGKIQSTKEYTSSPSSADMSDIFYKGDDGKMYHQQSQTSIDSNGNKYVVKSVNETKSYKGDAIDKGFTKVSMAQINPDGVESVLFKNREMSTHNGGTVNANQMAEYMKGYHDNGSSDSISRYLDKSIAFSDTNIPQSMITGATKNDTVNKQTNVPTVKDEERKQRDSRRTSIVNN